MDEHIHLHEGEHLLLMVHPSIAYFLRGIIRSLIDGILAAVVLTLLVVVLLQFAFLLTFFTIWLIATSFLVFLRYRHWRHSLLRVTTERILLQHAASFFSLPLRTIKWSQYQESALGHRSILDIPFRVRSLVIRYGAADSKLYLSFPAVPLAHDIKHFLDKIDSAVRRGQTAGLKPFEFKPRGERDAS